MLFATQNQPQLLSDCIIHLTNAHDDLAIYNPEFNDIRSRLNNAISNLWSKIRSDHYLSIPYDDRSTRIPEDQPASDLYYESLSSFHSVTAFGKKLEKYRKPLENHKLYGPFFEYAEKAYKELLPLTNMMNNLKPYIIKGRKKSEEPPPPPNPNMVIGTCPVCSRAIAVRDGTMVHHGYMRPGGGVQTQSCYGVNHAPYERSKEGCVAMLEHAKKKIEEHTEILSKKNEWASITIMVHKRGHRFPVAETILPTDSRWDRVKRQEIEMHRNKIRMNEQSRDHYQKMIQDWKLLPLHKADRTILPIDYDGNGAPP